MNPTEIKAALEGILKATSRTTLTAQDKASPRLLVHCLKHSQLMG